MDLYFASRLFHNSVASIEDKFKHPIILQTHFYLIRLIRCLKTHRPIHAIKTDNKESSRIDVTDDEMKGGYHENPTISKHLQTSAASLESDKIAKNVIQTQLPPRAAGRERYLINIFILDILH